MRVGISLLTLSPGDLGGSEIYARQLVRALAAVGELDYTAFVTARARDAAGGLPAVFVRELPVARRGPPRIPALSIAARASRELQTALGRVDVVHYPLTVPIPRARLPKVITLQDVQHLDLPELFSASRRAFRRRAYDRAAQTADAVIVTSEFVRGRALETLGLDAERVHVIPLGIDHALFHPTEEPREPFLLYPARPWPHKNHGRLMQAFSLLRAELPELRLVLTGGGLEQLEPIPAGVERLGIVPLEELATLYRRAACLVFPSLYEGFGLPPLEAMACGCPVAASNAGAVPEICGPAAVLFDPMSVDAIATGVREALALADELREEGIARAAGFTWENTARRHDAIYRDVATGARAGTSTTP
ncbi:MAG: glycosyltransferase family 4 protein [Actinobacteria bacterium]|nr:glycosyltransferase family 4 protein [Actinomycetota bacterium]